MLEAREGALNPLAHDVGLGLLNLARPRPDHDRGHVLASGARFRGGAKELEQENIEIVAKNIEIVAKDVEQKIQKGNIYFLIKNKLLKNLPS